MAITETGRFTHRTTNKIRIHHQSQNRQADRPHNPEQSVGESRSGHQIIEAHEYRTMKQKVLGVVLTVGVLFFTSSFSARGQPQAKLSKIGWLDSGPTVRGTMLGELFLLR